MFDIILHMGLDCDTFALKHQITDYFRLLSINYDLANHRIPGDAFHSWFKDLDNNIESCDEVLRITSACMLLLHLNNEYDPEYERQAIASIAALLEIPSESLFDILMELDDEPRNEKIVSIVHYLYVGVLRYLVRRANSRLDELLGWSSSSCSLSELRSLILIQIPSVDLDNPSGNVTPKEDFFTSMNEYITDLILLNEWNNISEYLAKDSAPHEFDHRTYMKQLVNPKRPTLYPNEFKTVYRFKLPLHEADSQEISSSEQCALLRDSLLGSSSVTFHCISHDFGVTSSKQFNMCLKHLRNSGMDKIIQDWKKMPSRKMDLKSFAEKKLEESNSFSISVGKTHVYTSIESIEKQALNMSDFDAIEIDREFYCRSEILQIETDASNTYPFRILSAQEADFWINLSALFKQPDDIMNLDPRVYTFAHSIDPEVKSDQTALSNDASNDKNQLPHISPDESSLTTTGVETCCNKHVNSGSSSFDEENQMLKEEQDFSLKSGNDLKCTPEYQLMETSLLALYGTSFNQPSPTIHSWLKALQNDSRYCNKASLDSLIYDVVTFIDEEYCGAGSRNIFVARITLELLKLLSPIFRPTDNNNIDTLDVWYLFSIHNTPHVMIRAVSCTPSLSDPGLDIISIISQIFGSVVKEMNTKAPRFSIGFASSLFWEILASYDHVLDLVSSSPSSLSCLDMLVHGLVSSLIAILGLREYELREEIKYHLQLSTKGILLGTLNKLNRLISKKDRDIDINRKRMKREKILFLRSIPHILQKGITLHNSIAPIRLARKLYMISGEYLDFLPTIREMITCIENRSLEFYECVLVALNTIKAYDPNIYQIDLENSLVAGMRIVGERCSKDRVKYERSKTD